ncbi:uroporphyrinogen-III synthase [Methylophilaceae bacterium]|nr:uroporphyrinogen-III synthase [Methylophilaceae bacterium]
MSKKELHQTGIVITRPSHQTGEIKALVNEHQGHPIEFPLLEIQSKSQNETFQNIVLTLNDYDWAIFISSNAVQFGMPAVKHAFHTLPESTKFAAIGPSTQKALKLFDVNHVLIPEENFDSEGLLATEEMNDIKNKKIVIFRGEGGRETLAETLRARGAEVTYAECYTRTFPQTNLDLLKLSLKKFIFQRFLLQALRHVKSLFV